MTTPFENWSGQVTATPRSFERPRDVAAVAHAVREARQRGGRVHVVGSGHSWSPIMADDDVLLHLGGLDGLVGIDPDAGTVTAQAGCTLAALVAVLARQGLGPRILGSIMAQTVAGAVATGTHGSSLEHGNLATAVTGMTLVDGRGELVTVAGDSAEGVGGRVHLGALGLLTEVSLAVGPRRVLRETRERVALPAVIEQLPDIARSAEYVKVWWLPPSPHAVIYRYEVVDEVAPEPGIGAALDGLVNRTVFPAMLAAGGRLPALIGLTNRIVDTVHLTAGTRVGWLDHVLTLPMPPVHRETEWSVSMDHSSGLLAAWVDWVLQGRVPIDFITEVRFVAGDPAWLSPAHGRDSCQLGVYAARTRRLAEAFAAFTAMARERGGRPHWGKEHDPASLDLDALYPEAGQFRALRAQRDPDGLFVNGYLDALLAPPV